MSEFRDTIVENLIALRKENSLTQIDLAKRINYSDKAVSRWETGEVLPDLETLKSISEVYNVPVSYFLEKHDFKKEKTNPQLDTLNKVLVSAVSICVVWTMAIIAFIYVDKFLEGNFWQVFVWAVPLSCVVVRFYCKKWRAEKLVIFICFTVFLWSVITCFYVQFIDLNLWLLYIVGIPIQIARLAIFLMEK